MSFPLYKAHLYDKNGNVREILVENLDDVIILEGIEYFFDSYISKNDGKYVEYDEEIKF